MQPHAIITSLKAIRMLLDGSGVLVRAERWKEIEAMSKHCCQSLITEDHTDYCLSRQELIVQLQDEADRLREQRATLRTMLRIRRHNGEPWAVGFARLDWPKVAEILGVTIESVEWCPDCGYAHRPEPCVPAEASLRRRPATTAPGGADAGGA